MKAMKELRRALSNYVDVVALGSPRTEALRQRLREIHGQNTNYFRTPVLMLAVTFFVAMALIIYGAAGTSGATAIAALFGISVIGMIRLMLSFWREKVATEIIIELSELDDDVLRKVAAKLLARMQ
jgi:hypothetical protein